MSTNDITGARLVSRVNDKNYEDGYDRIFRNKNITATEILIKEAERIRQLQKSEEKTLEPLVNRMLDFCVKYEEAENTSKEIKNLIKDNEKVEND